MALITRLALSWSKPGYGVAYPDTVGALERALTERGLTIPRAKSGLYDMDRGVRILVLTLFAQTLRGQLGPQGINLHLATGLDSMVADMTTELNRYVNRISHSERFPSEYPVDALNPLQLTNDLHDVGADLSAVPLDEVLCFREENGQYYRAYAKGLRELLATLAQAGPSERQRIIQERTSDIQDRAANLRRVSQAAFGTQAATLLVSLAGAAWTLHTGDPIGAILAGASAGLQAVPIKDQGITAYSYLLRALDLGRG